MPNDEGLRRCKCGQFVQIKDMVPVEKIEVPDAGEDEQNDLLHMDRVPDELLPECIAKACATDNGLHQRCLQEGSICFRCQKSSHGLVQHMA